ncbi:hypothetical protein [Haloarchaeobius sp. TZWSO28]|uniref:hypothetical protein n=1 Tax=Haloarchaeobius sp. TZWSO28 TaxID=3446119 RepID=UPI003EBC88FF
MNRRAVLAGVCSLATVGAGCLSIPADRDAEFTVENPPAWLQTADACPPEERIAMLDVAGPSGSAGESTAVVNYGELREESQLVFRFGVQHGGAVTCHDSGANAFSTLLGDVMENALQPYREEHLYGADAVAIRGLEGFYGIELQVYDQVLP